ALAGPTCGERRPVRSIGGERVVHVGYGYDARAQGNRIAGEPIGIAATVVTLVMVPDDESAIGEEIERRHDLGAGERVASHEAPLVVREGPGRSPPRAPASPHRGCGGRARRPAPATALRRPS